MKLHKHTNGSIWAFEPDGSQDHLITPDMQAVTDAEADAIRNPIPTTPVIPQTVSRFQARAALHLSGHLSQVETIIASPQTDMLTKLAWQDAQEFRRDSPTLLTLATALGLTDVALDALFVQAATITA
jgi:hypothetical protein